MATSIIDSHGRLSLFSSINVLAKSMFAIFSILKKQGKVQQDKFCAESTAKKVLRKSLLVFLRLSRFLYVSLGFSKFF